MIKAKIISQIMGSGKSSGIVNMLNYDPAYKDRKVIYIAPFLSEAKRFARSCDREFVEPKAWSEFDNSKLTHTRMLLSENKSISTTHAAFMRYDDEILRLVREGDYILIMDETCNVMEDFSWNPADVWVLQQAGIIFSRWDRFIFNDDYEHYLDSGGALADLCRKMKHMDLRCYTEEDTGRYFYYTMPPEILKSFSDVFVLTYMWECSDLCTMMNMIGMEWEYRYIEQVDYGNGYMITDEKPEIPEYVKKIPELIHIYEHEPSQTKRGKQPRDLNSWVDKRGRIQKKRPFKLSVWFFQNKKKNHAVITELKNNIRTYFRKILAEHGGSRDECMWSTYKDYMDELYSEKNSWLESRFVSFNERAKNEYAGCKYLAYAVDIFPNPIKERWYERNGFTYQSDMVALSTMCQWIWRSAIRKGEDIYIYVPAERMRNLLKDWLRAIGNGEMWCEI